MTNQSAPPRFENAPGLVVRARRDGSWVAFWQARTDIAKAGYRPPYVPLWRGLKPSRADQVYVADRCHRFQNEMLTYAHGGVQQVATFDGTIRSLIDCYRSDTDSSYFKIRYRTRENYDSLCRRILADLGDKAIREIDARTLLRSHERWTEDGHIAMAHSLMGMMRTLATFGATLLKSRDCRELKVTLADMRFTTPKPRTERLTAEHAEAIRAKAHEVKLPELALAQAIQFEAMLRQKDVIGEWVPQAEPGLSDVTYAGQKWLRGIRWNEIDANLILRHTTSKRGKDVEVDLKLAPMVMAEFKAIYGSADRAALPAAGPVIVYSETGRPFITYQFRWVWRKVADLAGIPRSVRNMDSRAGAISEATDAGAELEHVRHAATHSNISMTSRYSRGAAEKTAKVMQQRAAHRSKTGRERS